MDMKFDPVTGERIQEDGAAQQEQAVSTAAAQGTGDPGQSQQAYFYQQSGDAGQPKKKKRGVIIKSVTNRVTCCWCWRRARQCGP